MDFSYEIKTGNGEMDVYLKGYLDTAHATGLMDDMKKHIGEKYSKAYE